MLRRIYEFGEFRLDAAERTICRAGEPVPLPPKAFDLLVILLEQHGRLVAKDELLKRVWPDTFVEETNLPYSISILRKALGDSSEQSRMIETIPKRGYRFVTAVSVAEDYGIAQSDLSSSACLPEPPIRSPRRNGIWFALVTATILVATGGRWMAVRPGRHIEFRERDLVLVAQFQNDTGEQDLNGVLETALEAELTQTPYLGIAPPDRVDDALRLMRQPPASRASAALAREVCLRDPGMRAAIIGHIRKVGSAYLLDAEIIRPADGRVMVSINRTASDKNAILPVVGRMAAAIRGSLGEESSAKGTEQSPSKVTTSSLAALKLYSDAELRLTKNRHQEAEVLLRRAVEIDPQFASASMLLAWAIRNQLPASSQAFMPFAERALALTDGVSEREVFFIRGSYYSLTDQHEKAIPYYEAMMRRYPDHRWVVGNLLMSNVQNRQYTQAGILTRQMIQMRPNDPAAYLRAVPACLCPPNPDVRQAQSYVDRAMELVRQQGDPEQEQRLRLWRAYYSALAAWAEGDVTRCLARLDEVTKELPDDGWGVYTAAGYMTLGRVQQAERLLERVNNTAVRQRWRMWNALLAGDMRAASKMAAAMKDGNPNPLTAIAMIRAGQVDAATRMIQRLNPGFYVDSAMVARSQLSLRHNRLGETVELLPEVLRSISNAPLAERLLAPQILAEAYSNQGNLDRAISVLEEATAAPRTCGEFLSAVFWPLLRYDLMRLYGRQNRLKEAAAVRQELEGLLGLADANYVIRAALGEHGGDSTKTRHSTKLHAGSSGIKP